MHNILEAATYGKPIIFGKGKDNKTFNEAVELVAMGGAFEIESSRELRDKLDLLLHSEAELDKARRITENYVAERTGATEAIFEHIKSFLK